MVISHNDRRHEICPNAKVSI